MMRFRLERLGRRPKVIQGSALDIPWGASTFDYVYSIGCLHHTGNLQRAIDEVWRVLKPAGRAIVMLYNENSWRQLVRVKLPLWRQRLQRRGSRTGPEDVRALYDTNSAGDAAPHTDYVSRRDVRRLFARFRRVRTDVQNFDSFYLPYRHIYVPREKCLNNIARILGLDLYITAVKR
jgi:ubiquinone/menaquinone biosynthesis C-methylase UbiE